MPDSGAVGRQNRRNSKERQRRELESKRLHRSGQGGYGKNKPSAAARAPISMRS